MRSRYVMMAMGLGFATVFALSLALWGAKRLSGVSQAEAERTARDVAFDHPFLTLGAVVLVAAVPVAALALVVARDRRRR